MAEESDETAVDTVAVIDENEEAEAQKDVSEEPLRARVWYDTYYLDIEAYSGYAYITYPDFITEDEVLDASEAAYNKYSQYLDGVYVIPVGDGIVKLTYPENFTSEDFVKALSVLEEELPSYVDSTVASYNTEESVTSIETITVNYEKEEDVSTASDHTSEETPVAILIEKDEKAEAPLHEEEERKAETTSSSDKGGSTAVIKSSEDDKKEETVYPLYRKESISIWGTGYGMAEKVLEGKSFNARRLTRSYIYAFNVEYDYRLSKLFTIGVKTGYEGVIFHVGGYTSQIPLLMTAGMVPYEKGHSKLAFDIGVGVDAVESVVKKSFALIGDLSLSYTYKLGEYFALSLGTSVRCGYTFSDKEFRLEIMPLLLGAAFTF